MIRFSAVKNSVPRSFQHNDFFPKYRILIIKLILSSDDRISIMGINSYTLDSKYLYWKGPVEQTDKIRKPILYQSSGTYAYSPVQLKKKTRCLNSCGFILNIYQWTFLIYFRNVCVIRQNQQRYMWHINFLSRLSSSVRLNIKISSYQ